ncbi:hypothetical protein [Streptococcus sp. 2022WUSS037]|uniref:hypothetical protein n=1 Tax=Streptococcus sp. 2022WUSS037 TaxID=2983286 RepID=UPI0037A0B53D
MSKQMEYRKQIEVIESQLTKENKEYMGRINGYMMIASVFHRQEEAVTAQLLSIYQDVLEAQKDGLSASPLKKSPVTPTLIKKNRNSPE